MMVLLKSYQNVLRHQLGLIFSTLNGFWVVHGLKFRGWGCPLGPSGITASSSMRRLWRSVTLATRSPITERSHPNFSDVKHVGENEIQSDLFFTVCSFFYIFSSHWHISSLKVSMLGVPVISNSLWPHRLQPTRLLCPWDSLGKNTGVDCCVLFQRIFLTQRLNPCLTQSIRFLTAEPPGKLRPYLYCLYKCLSWTLLNTGIKYTRFRRMMNKSSTRRWKHHRKVEIWDTWLNKGFLIRKTANSLAPRGHTGHMTWHKYWNSITLKIRIKLPTLWMLVWWVLTNRYKVNLSIGSIGNFY